MALCKGSRAYPNCTRAVLVDGMRCASCLTAEARQRMADERRAVAGPPQGLRWATGGGSTIGGCNGLHLAKADQRGTLCGRYGPATPTARVGDTVCGSCASSAKVPRVVPPGAEVVQGQ